MSTSGFSDDELSALRAIFLVEAQEHLQILQACVGRLRLSPTDRGALDALRRELHTLKGAAGSVGLDDVMAASSSLEWIFMLELFGEWHDKSEMGGMVDDSMGGTTVYLAPGARAKLASGWSFYASIGFPVIQNLNGVQPDSEFYVTTGLSYGF